MEIIATTGADKFLVEATSDELARVMGYSYDTSVPNYGDRFKIGCVIRVGEAWNDLKRFRDAAAQIEKAAEILRATASLADKVKEDYIVSPEPEAAETTE